MYPFYKLLPETTFCGGWSVEWLMPQPGKTMHLSISKDDRRIILIFSAAGSMKHRFAFTKSFDVCIYEKPGAAVGPESGKVIRGFVKWISGRDDGNVALPETINGKSELVRPDDMADYKPAQEQVHIPVKLEFRLPTQEEIDALIEVSDISRLVFWLESSTCCNRKCIFCTRKHIEYLPEQEADLRRYERAFLRLNLKIGARRLNITEADPLHHPCLEELLLEAKSCGFSEICVKSGGGFSTSAYTMSQCGKAGLDIIEVPVYGPDERMHDYITGREGAFHETLNGIEQAIAAGIDVSIHTLPLKLNLKTLPAIAELVRGRFPSAELMVFNYHPETDDPEQYIKLMPRYSEIVETVEGLGLDLRLPCCVSGHLLPEGGILRENEQIRFNNLLIEKKLTCGATKGESPIYMECCRGCSAKDRCPGVPDMYFRCYGSDEFSPFE